LKDTVQLGLETGDKTYAMAFLRLATFLNFFLRDRLDEAQENMTQNIRLLQQSGDIENLSSVLVWTQFVANLRGRSADPLCFDGPIFDEASDLPPAQAAGLYQTTYYLRLLKLILHYHLGHYQAALAYSEEAEPLLPYFLSQYLIPLLPFYQSLAILQLPDGEGRPPKLVKKLEQNLQKLQLWARHAPMNHQHKVDLVLAEQARVAGDVAGAIDHYEAAIAGARENEYRHEEALANELYARFWIEQGNDRFAGSIMRDAHALYRRWGAAAIVEHLEAQYPQWLTSEVIDIAPSHPETGLTKTPSSVDLRSILRASQAIAGEIDLETLLGQLMAIVMENAGAERAFLILEQEGAWFIEAAAETGEAKPRVKQAIPIAENDLLSERVVRYVARTQRRVVLGDATTEARFSRDAYIQDKQVKSLLCIPLVNQGETSAILYLENNLATDAFSPDRVALLEMLASQMAIAIDNARLYRQLGNLLAARTRALYSAEAQIQSLFENTDLGIVLTTFEGQVIATNQALLDMTGYTQAEMGQRNIATLYRNPDQRTLLLQELQSKPTVQSFGIQARRKDGTHFFASLNVSLVTHDEREVLLTIVEDVTDKFQAEEALRTSQVLLQSALDALSANIAVLDKNGVIISVNASWRAFAEANGLGWADYGVGRSYLEPLVAASARSAEGAAEATAGIQALLSGQRDSFSLDYDCHSPSEERWFTMRATCFKSSDGMRVVISHEDITPRVQAEKQLAQAAAAAERNRMARELHDSVTQALFTTTLFAQAGRKGVESGDLGSAAHHLNRILETAHQALKEMRLFIYDLLPEQLDHLGLVDAIQRRLNAVEKRAGIKVSLTAGELGDLPGPVNEGLYRITQEALNNSLKHAQADVVKVTIDKQVQRLCLEIIDNGQGFDPLQAHDGGGLGLISMRERTEQLGGEFNIDSAPQGGTRICVVLEVSE
jgi:PAS domain S-box-containing protein